jgi:hypothetical protein
VVLVIALIMVALLLLGGLVIDLGGLRGFRGSQQAISDAAAAAGAMTLAETRDGQAACDAAKAYVITNGREIDSLAGIDCSLFPAVCDSTTDEVTVTTVEGRFTIGITHPVSDASPLMDSEILGAPDQPASSEDGHQCERIAVSIHTTFGTTFSQLAGIDELPANVHTVAKASMARGHAYPVNLLVLDRTGCQTIHSSGNGGIYVDAVYDDDEDDDPSNGLQPVLEPGLAASDSDGSAGCGGSDGVIDIDGSNAVIRADGPEGCSSESGTHLVVALIAGEGCGTIQTIAPGTPGCNFPACTAGGGNAPNPDPTELPLRLTRAAVDYRYNCKPDYTTIPAAISWSTWALTAAGGQDIPGCLDAGPAHIDDLIAAVGQTGTPIGFQSWTGAGYPCTVQGSPGTTILVPAGNWHVDCPVFAVKRTVVFQGGNVVADGPIEIEASGILAINAAPGSYAAVDPEAWVFLRSGYLRKAGDAVLIMNNTFLYASKNAHVEMMGGDGRLVWIAPDQGDFDDLALWGDSPTTHLWAGQADLEMEGVFFTPFAQADYAGTAGQNQVRAQFVAHTLHARGQGTLVVAPEYGRSVQFPRAESALIR